MQYRSHNYGVVPIQKNSNYEKDTHYTLQIARWFWKILGVWPFVYHTTKFYEKIIAIILLIMFFFDLTFASLPPFLHLVRKERNVYRMMKLFGPLFYIFSSMLKYFYIIQKGSIFTNCIIRVERDWKAVDNANDRNIMLKYATISRNLITACAIFIYTGGVFYQALTHFFQKFTPKGDNVTRTLSYPGYDKLFDTQASPTFEIIHFLHYLSGFLKYTIAMASYSLAVICVTHICGQIQIQISRLENLVEKTKQNINDNTYFANIIESHSEILSFARDVEVALREICLTTIVECTLVLCLLEYYCLTEWPNSDMIPIFTYAVLMLSFTFNIFIFNYIGELLSEKCSKIGQTSYEIDWYTLPPKKASYLILVHAVSLYPPKLTGGKIFVLSLYTFGTVMKSSVVYLNLLRTVSEW